MDLVAELQASHAKALPLEIAALNTAIVEAGLRG